MVGDVFRTVLCSSVILMFRMFSVVESLAMHGFIAATMAW